MICPFCKKEVWVVSPYDYEGKVVEACIDCATSMQLLITDKIGYTYSDEIYGKVAIPNWRADIPAGGIKQVIKGKLK